MGLRDFQQECLNRTLATWGYAPLWDGEAPTSQRCVVNLPTSSGKTVIAAHLADWIVANVPNARVLFIGDREELIQQPIKKFYEACGIMAALHRGQDHASPNASVIVASIQTLARRLPPGRPITHIIDDESHRNTETRAKIHAAYPDAKVVGFTATAFRKNMADLSKWYPVVAFELRTFDLIDEGYITPIKVLTLPLEIDLRKVEQRSGDYNQDQVSDVLTPWFDKIAEAIKEHAPKRTILAFLPLISTSIKFAARMNEHGLLARHVDGGTHDRHGQIQAFEEGEFQILSNSQVFSTGVDFLKCDCLLNLAVTRSRVEFRQRAGRIMRLLKGTIDPGGVVLPTAEERRAAIAASAKPDCLILDLLWQTRSIGLAGPASLAAMNEEDEEVIADRLKKAHTPEELAEISAEVQRTREEQLAEELREQARKATAAHTRAASLQDARQLVLNLHDRDLLTYEPVNAIEAAKVSPKHAHQISALGFEPKAIFCDGLAVKLLEAVHDRQQNGLAPIEAFEALKAAGIEHPEKCSLNKAIQMLGENFPMTFGKKYLGVPLKDIKRKFWRWLLLGEESDVDGEYRGAHKARKVVQEKHPAVWRYAQKIILPTLKAREQQAALPI